MNKLFMREGAQCCTSGISSPATLDDIDTDFDSAFTYGKGDRAFTTMNELFDNYHVTKMTLQGLGLWPYQDFSTRMAILTVVMCDLVSISIPMVWYFIEESNVAEMVNCLPALCMLYVAYISIITGALNVNKVRNILNFMEATWKNSMDKEEKLIFEKYGKEGQFIATMITGIAMMAGIVFTSLPWVYKGLDSIFEPNATHPMQPILKVNFYKLDPNEHYLLIYLHSWQACWIIIIPTVVYDIYLQQVIHHGTSMFAVLNRKIENVSQLNRDSCNEMSGGELDKVLSNELKTCIRYHWEAISFFQMVDGSVKYLWLFRFFVDASMITIMGVQTIVSFGNPILMLSNALNATGITIHLFCITWASQQLLDHSVDLNESLYNIEWYEFPPRSKKLISIMLLKSSTPCNLTAGGMIDLNLETFYRFLKLSASYFTMVLSTM